MWVLGMMLSGPYDVFKNKQISGMYNDIGRQTYLAERGIFNIIMDAGVYVSAIAVLVSAATLIICSRSKGGKLAEAKGGVIKVFLLSILFFAIIGLISLVQKMGLD